ncbi:MAG: TIM-barrel domain-containing protein [Planctomycetota bacterium]|jgi:alpha-glucosidase (family GH31 glycosyl hydrolase)
MARIFLALAGTLIAHSVAIAETIIVDNIRVQILTPNLIRLEERGLRGFEDRTTFHVTGRSWPPVTDVHQTAGQNTTMISVGAWQLRIKRPADSILGIEILDGGDNLLYQCDGSETNSNWLPQPGDMQQAWSFADNPRIVPPTWGSLPPPPDLNMEHAATSGWDVSNDARDIYVFLPGGSYETLRRDFLKLTGRSPMPPLYALGAWDSRYHPYSDKTALAQIDGYRSRSIPLDVFVVDTDWRVGASHGYGINTELFPDMGRFVRAASDKHVRLMYNDHPEPVAQAALDPKELQYRYDGLKSLLDMGIDIWWYDRNWMTHLHEPAPGIRKEVWGMRLYSDITRSHRPDNRPMIMANVDGIDNGRRNRPPNVAAHRFPIQWTGDTRCHIRDLQAGIENALYSGVHGLNAYVSEDLGGHMGRPSLSTYVRWVQFGAMSPIFRLHCTRGDIRAPWEFGPTAESIARDYIQMRYQLLPVLYAAARENHETGEPIVRRLDLEWPEHDSATRHDQYLLGGQILVAPICKDPAKPVPTEWLKTTDGQAGLAGQYFTNPELEGEPAYERLDPHIDFRWSGKEPAPGIPSDDYSVRWTGRIGPIPESTLMRLRVSADDGVRVFLNDKIVVDEWQPQAEASFWAIENLRPGEIYDLRVEFQQFRYDSVCRLEYAPADEESRDTRTVWIPPGSWIDVWSGEVVVGPVEKTVSASLRQMPMYVRAGSIIPLAPALQHVDEKPWSPITLDVYPSNAENGEFVLYEDDGMTNSYQDGKFRKTKLHMDSDQSEKSIRISIDPADGSYPGAILARAWQIRIHIPVAWRDRGLDFVKINEIVTTNWSMIEAYKSAMPFATSGGSPDGQVLEIAVPEMSVAQPIIISARFSPR